MAKPTGEGKSRREAGIGNVVAPWRFLAFAVVAIAGGLTAAHWLDWRLAVMIGFDAAALLFFLLCAPLLGHDAAAMRDAAMRNDANRATLLALTGSVMFVILVAIAAELRGRGATPPATVILIIATLAIAWLFSNIVYALHYAHLFYTRTAHGGDHGGLGFPKNSEPDYWDFAYFAFTLGMTFQTSDVEIDDAGIRRTVLFHCLAAFAFNIGVLAFTINILGG